MIERWRSSVASWGESRSVASSSIHEPADASGAEEEEGVAFEEEEGVAFTLCRTLPLCCGEKETGSVLAIGVGIELTWRGESFPGLHGASLVRYEISPPNLLSSTRGCYGIIN